MTSNSSCNNLAGLRNKIKIRMSSGSSTVDMASACLETTVAPSALASSTVCSDNVVQSYLVNL